MIKPAQIEQEAKKKENENIKFRSFLKNYFPDMTVASAGIAVSCTADRYRKKTWNRMRPYLN